MSDGVEHPQPYVERPQPLGNGTAYRAVSDDSYVRAGEVVGSKVTAARPATAAHHRVVVYDTTGQSENERQRVISAGSCIQTWRCSDEDSAAARCVGVHRVVSCAESGDN